ncbi:MarR family transcriptional regulator [Pinisolibacter aquiterrae]|jgi:DNA-binding MarR family transcriptional regulator|uniref:MarR family winged helix-turn-helix transcriptional regulator n=1 Tax=Pinisolibacter aquiterrae TaxID=2815579 RepID=UPI001C3C92C1|nr:MarR family transcriptional regulator [Pinisolibacter aquiterrae]
MVDTPPPDDTVTRPIARPRRPSAPPRAPGAARPELPASAFLEMLELFFFAYRDFVADPDVILARYGFGRAHHRVLHFVDRNPGLSVAELLDILKITKQSLARVLKELVETGHIESRTGSTDRRQRLLYATDKGRALARSLSLPQIGRIAAAFQALGPDGAARARDFLRLMIDADERPRVSRYTNRPDNRTDPRRERDPA